MFCLASSYELANFGISMPSFLLWCYSCFDLSIVVLEVSTICTLILACPRFYGYIYKLKQIVDRLPEAKREWVPMLCLLLFFVSSRVLSSLSSPLHRIHVCPYLQPIVCVTDLFSYWSGEFTDFFLSYLRRYTSDVCQVISTLDKTIETYVTLPCIQRWRRCLTSHSCITHYLLVIS